MTLGLFLLIFLGFLFLGMPVGFAMITGGFFYLIFSGDFINLVMMPEKVFGGINVFVLTAIPFFMLAGDIMNRSSISDKLISFSNIVIGRVRGGLAQVNVMASILFAGITGVALGDIAALGTVFVPAMEKQGYDKEFSAGITAASSLVGPIIPPSTMIVLYAAIMEVSVGGLFLGAIIPGLMIGLTDMIMVALISSHRKYPKVNVKINMKMFIIGLRDALLALMMPVIIIGGLLIGIFTPTEAAAVSVFYAVIVGMVIFRSLNWKDILDSLKSAVRGSAKLYLIIAGASVITWVFGAEQVPTIAENFFLSITANRIILILLINIFFCLWEPGWIPGFLLFFSLLLFGLLFHNLD